MAEGVDLLNIPSLRERGRGDSPAGRTARSSPHPKDGPSVRNKPEILDRDGVLATLGYKPDKSWKVPGAVLDKSELCIRCGKKVYPVEKVDVGGLYHRGCFKCKICNVQLTLKSFQRDVDVQQPDKTKEIYCKIHVSSTAMASSRLDAESMEIRRAMDAQKHASMQMRGTGYDHLPHYDPEALEFQHAKDIRRRKKKKRRSSTLRSNKDFEKFGVYDAQNALEEVHREEENELYRQMAEDRKRHVDMLSRHLVREKDKTVSDLIKWFESKGASKEEKENGLRKIENYYQHQHEERMQLLLQRLTIEEQSAVARMIEKHSQEMLVLIQEKEEEAERAMKFEFRESQLLEGNVVVEQSEDSEDDDSDEDDEDEAAQEISESFSEASYQVGLIEDSPHLIKEQSDQRVPEPIQNITDNMDLIADPNDNGIIAADPFSSAFLKANEKLAKSKQRPTSHRSDRTSISSHADKTRQGNRNSLQQDISTAANNSSPQHNNRARGPSNSPHRNNRSHPNTHIDVTRPTQPAIQRPAFQPAPRGQYEGDFAPPKDFPNVGTNADGTIWVKVQAAPDAHLIDDNLKSSHICFSPGEKDPNWKPGFGGHVCRAEGHSHSPKPYRRSRLESKQGQVPQGGKILGSPSQGRRGGKNGQGKFMFFQTPNNVTHEGSEFSSDEDGPGGTKGRKGKENARKARGSTASRRSGKGGRQAGTDKTKSHAERAKEALRAMSLGLDMSKVGEGNDDVFTPATSLPPKIEPPPTKKTTLYTTPEVFKEFDDNAINETKREHSTFTDLVRKLSRRCENELQKVRAIFRWVTAKDLDKMQFSEAVDPDSPLGLMRGIKLGVESYHNLFKRLCSYAGLHCEIIDGYSKGAGYRPGARFKGNTFRNQWTAVSVEGHWRFINCNWGARHVKGPKDDHMTYKIDEFYFMTDPEEHIYQHFPDDQNWQLLRKPITLDQFIKLPVVKSPFFNRQLAFGGDYESTVHTSDGNVEIRIISPKLTTFAAKLKSKDGHVRSEVLQDRVLVRVVNDEAIFQTNLPSTGNYYMEIYTGDRSDTDSMDNACAFRVCCYSVSSNAHVSYPPIACFGRTSNFKKHEVREETHSDPYIIHNGELFVAFLCSKNVKITHSLKVWNHRDRKLEDIDRYAFLSHRSDHMISYVIHCPKRAGYVFSLLAADPNSSEMKTIYRYYIECRTPSENAHPLPKASKRWQHCRLVEPIMGDIPCKSRVRFRIESSAALELVISVNQSWISLHKSGHLWQGVINTGEETTKLHLYGRFDSSTEKYIPLLEYNVKGPRGIEEELKTLMKYNLGV